MHHKLNPSPTQHTLEDRSAVGCCLRVALRRALSLLMPALLPGGDESAMNLEAVGGFFDIFYFPQHFLRVGSALRREHVASPSIATEHAASGRSYRLGLRGSDNTCLRYYRVLMYECETNLP